MQREMFSWRGTPKPNPPKNPPFEGPIPPGKQFPDQGGKGSGDGDYYDYGAGSNKNPNEGSNLTINTQPKGQKSNSNKYLAAGAGGYYYYLMKKNNDENEKKRQACKRACVPQNWDEFLGYEESLWKTCKELSAEEKEEKECKSGDDDDLGFGDDYCEKQYENPDEDCKYYKSEKPNRGELVWQPGPGREPEPDQPYCTGDLDSPIEETCPALCEEECNELHPKTNPFDPSTWWNALKDTWPFSELPDNLPWTTIILVVMAVILVPIILSLVK